MGKKRRAIAHPNKFKARARNPGRTRAPAAAPSNSEAIEELATKVEVAPAPEPVVATPAVAEEEPAPVKRANSAKKKTSKTRRTTTKKVDSSEA